MSFLEEITKKYQTMSIIGMSKNSGKTVTLNHILSMADEDGIPVGITSIGRDGERMDIVTETEKPTIYLTRGSLVATTTELLKLSDAVVEILEMTSYETPLGSVLLGRVKYDGYIQISGPQTLAETKVVLDKMIAYGAKLAILDGAIDRKTSAAPEITQCAVLAAGASVHRSMTEVVKRTAYVASLFSLPVIDIYRDKIGDILDRDSYGIISQEGEVREIPLQTSLNAGGKIAAEFKEDSKIVVLSGALTTKTLVDLVQATDRLQDMIFVVKDATKIFVSQRELKRCQRKGLNLAIFHKSELVLVTVNPYATQGYRFEPFQFKESMENALKGIPVEDVMMGESS